MENDLIFTGENPVIVHSYGSSDNIYNPVKCASCDINIVNSKILDDLYTPYKDDILVLIQRMEQEYDIETVITNPGSVGVDEITPTPDSVLYHTIYQRDAFYEDIDGVFRFKGILENSNGRWPVNLYYDYDDKDWGSGLNTWQLQVNGNGVNEQYFHDGTHSYKVDWDGTSHYISTWDGTTWTDRRAYHKIEGGTISDMAYGCNQIYHLLDGTIELLFGTSRYGWDPNWKRWYKKTNYVVNGGGSYYAAYGSWYHRIKNQYGDLVDAVVVNGINSEDWIMEIDKTSNLLFKMVKLQSSYDIDNIFTDEDGNLYCVKDSGKILFWDWGSEEWYEWITFGGSGYQADTFGLDYVIPGNGTPDTRRVVIRFMDGDSTYKAMYLHNFHAPELTVKRIPTGEWTGFGDQWYGYVMPNTYSQPVTQNLDSITITAIDYISVLKYVTIDMLFSKPNIKTFGEIICAAIAYVFSAYERGPWYEYRWIMVEQSVAYGGEYDGTNGLFDLKCQVSNFWDESGKAATAYDVISEILRPFSMQLSYDTNHGYTIFNVNNTDHGRRECTVYYINADGSYDLVQDYPESLKMYTNWKSNNIQDATIEIDTTYNKVTGVASTCVPSWSKMAMDLVDYNNRNLYDAGGLNVQTNKTKGYVKRNNNVTTDTNDKWFYIWNGVYTNPDYELESWNEYVNWYLNCNQAYQYMNDSTTPSSDHGSILNFYGGSYNPTATGKTQVADKSVEVHKRITAYAADNGVPPEFLEMSDLDWDGHKSGDELTVSKKNTSNTKFGDGIVMGDSNWVIYHQEYENVNMNMSNNPVVELSISRSFSRTGIDVPISIMNNNTASDVTYNIWGNFTGFGNSYYFPQPWNADNVIVNSIYFRRYAGSGTIRVKPVWDSTRVDMYVKTSDGWIYQFNGKEWVQDIEVKESNAFYLQKLMNFEHLYNTDVRYNVIETSDGQHYSLSNEPFVYYTKTYSGEEYVNDDDSGTAHKCEIYNSGVFVPVAGCSDGMIKIALPRIDDASPVVYVDIYNSTMLGMTGSDDIGGAFTNAPFYYALGGGEYKGNVYINFLPKNLSHVKGEHVELNISITVPESNIGQMFSQSDIEYGIKSNMNYIEEYSGPTFRVNTVHPLVSSSFSYIMFGNSYADPGEFIINGVATRPECYVVQAYFNWLTKIRKVYSKTFVLPEVVNGYLMGDNVINEHAFMKSPEIGDGKLMILSDDFDYKTYRHSVIAVECDDIKVDYVDTYMVNELPHKARAERWNLPTATK